MELLPLLADDDDDGEPSDVLCSLSCWMSLRESDRPVPSYLVRNRAPFLTKQRECGKGIVNIVV